MIGKLNLGPRSMDFNRQSETLEITVLNGHLIPY